MQTPQGRRKRNNCRLPSSVTAGIITVFSVRFQRGAGSHRKLPDRAGQLTPQAPICCGRGYVPHSTESGDCANSGRSYRPSPMPDSGRMCKLSGSRWRLGSTRLRSASIRNRPTTVVGLDILDRPARPRTALQIRPASGGNLPLRPQVQHVVVRGVNYLALLPDPTSSPSCSIRLISGVFGTKVQ